jgi:hypothetical protein
MNTIVVCIPRVFSNINEKRIRRVFDELNIGVIQRVDIVAKTAHNGDTFNRVFVHFERWFTNENAEKARERLLSGKEIKIIYDDPWFWKVSLYHEKKQDFEKKKQDFEKKTPLRSVAHFEFDDQDQRPPYQSQYQRSQYQRQEQRPEQRPDPRSKYQRQDQQRQDQQRQDQQRQDQQRQDQRSQYQDHRTQASRQAEAELCATNLENQMTAALACSPPNVFDLDAPLNEGVKIDYGTPPPARITKRITKKPALQVEPEVEVNL